MTKEAIRKREYRAKLPDEKKNATKAENAERSKLWRNSGTSEEIEAKKSKDAVRKKQSRAKFPDEEKIAFNFKEAARKREKRAQKKAANQQLAPENISVGPPFPNDEVQAGSSANATISMNEELSEYEQLRQRNINERNQKFTAQFGIANLFDQNQSKKRSLPKRDSTSESSDDEITPAVEPVRKQPKRKCTLQKATSDFGTDSDTSFEDYVDGLVTASLAETELYDDPNLVVKSIIKSIISSVCGSKPRKPNIGRKTKNAKRMAVSRYELLLLYFYFNQR